METSSKEEFEKGSLDQSRGESGASDFQSERRSVFSKGSTGTSSLLQLPFELRNQTYREVLGDRFIHLKYLRYTPPIPGLKGRHGQLRWNQYNYPNPGKEVFRTGEYWLQYVCNKKGPQSEEDLRFVGIIEDDSFAWRIATGKVPPGGVAWHDTAMPAPTLEEIYDREMHLGFLRVCRQIYREANPVLWASNMFSFETPNCCWNFMENLNNQQKESLRGLHLVIAGFPRLTPWNSVLNTSLLRSLEGVVELRLVIKDVMLVETYKTHKASGTLLSEHGEPRHSGVYLLSKLPRLETVEVRMMPDFHGSWQPWPQSMKDEFAELVKRKILDGRETSAC